MFNFFKKPRPDSPKSKAFINGFFSFFGLSVAGVCIFYVIISWYEQGTNFYINSLEVFGYSLICGLIWATVVFVISQKNQWKKGEPARIAKAKSAISDAVSNILNPK